MIVVAGALYLDGGDRARYLEGCLPVIIEARRTDGCLDFHLAADPIDPERINVFERWETVEAVERFRGSGPSAEQSVAIRDGQVFQYEISESTRL